MSPMRQRNLWRTAFLSLTGLAIVMECWASWDGNEDTDAWTNLITTYVPWELGAAVFGALMVWVPLHFITRYRKRAALERAAYERNPMRIMASEAERREHARNQGILIQGDTENPDQGRLF